MKSILITGSNGLLGQKLLDLYKGKADRRIIAASRGKDRYKMPGGYTYEEMDITNKESISEILTKHKPQVIIHGAAMTNVDACELDPEICRRSNVEAVKVICDTLEELRSVGSYDPHLIHISTDFIFDGEQGPYSESDLANPVSIYGQSKLDAEKIVAESKLDWCILRTILLYGVVADMSRSNIVLWAKGALEQGKSINVVDDQFRTPTLAEDLAKGCMLAEEKRAKGVYHISGEEQMSILEIVRKVAEHFKLDASLINPVSSTTLSQPAKRPPVTGFIIDKARMDLGYQPVSFKEGLAIVDRQLKELGSPKK